MFGISPMPPRTPTFLPSRIFRSASPVIIGSDITAAPALVPPNGVPDVYLSRMSLSNSASPRTSIVRFWSPPEKNTPVAAPNCAMNFAFFSASRGRVAAWMTEPEPDSVNCFCSETKLSSGTPLAHVITRICDFCPPLHSTNFFIASAGRAPPPTTKRRCCERASEENAAIKRTAERIIRRRCIMN